MKRLLPQDHKGVWILLRRVPKAYAHLDNRRFVKLTTGIRVAEDPRAARAARVILDLNAQLEQEWVDLAAGRDPKAQREFNKAQRRASDLGLSYRPAAELAGEPLEEILRRLEMLERLKAGDDRQVVDAALGGLERPAMMISELATPTLPFMSFATLLGSPSADY